MHCYKETKHVLWSVKIDKTTSLAFSLMQSFLVSLKYLSILWHFSRRLRRKATTTCTTLKMRKVGKRRKKKKRRWLPPTASRPARLRRSHAPSTCARTSTATSVTTLVIAGNSTLSITLSTKSYYQHVPTII